MNKRLNISGIFIFDKYPDEERRSSTCFEDCQEETQDKWLDSLEPEDLKNLSKQLAKILKNICLQFGITTKAIDNGNT